MGKDNAESFCRPGFIRNRFGHPNRKTIPVRVDFILLVLAVFLTNFRYWNAALMTTGDTIYIFQPFYIFYNDFFFHGDLTRWFPYGSYGIPAPFWQYNYLTAFSYLTGIVGTLFRVGNVMALFKFSVLFEQLAMMWGAYRLCGELFRNRVTVFFVCFGLVATTFWFLNPFWNFRIYYLMPLILYFLILFFRHRQGHKLWLGITVFCFSVIGSINYFAIIQSSVLLLFGLCLAAPDRFYMPWAFERSRKNALSFLLMAGVVTVFLYFACHMLDHTRNLTYGRDPDSLQVSIDYFLTFGAGFHWNKFLGLIFGIPYTQSTLYLGLLPLVFLLYGLGTKQGRVFAATWIVIIFLVLLSVGDKTPVARLAYFLFPPMRWFRYLGELGGLIRFFLLIAAGFGLDRFLDDPAHEKARKKKRILFFGCSAGFLLSVYFLAKLDIGEPLFEVPWESFFLAVITVLAVSLAVLNFCIGKPARVLGLVAVIFFGIDMGAYQIYTFKMAGDHWSLMPRVVSHVYPYVFQHQRGETAEIDRDDVDPRIRSVEKLMKSESFILFNSDHYGFMQFDPCYADYMDDLQLRTIHDVLVSASSFEIRYHIAQGKLKWQSSLRRTRSWRSIFACGEKKLRLYPGASLVEDKRLARLMSDREIDLGRTLVLRSESPASSPQPLPPPLPAVPLGNIHVRSFTFNRLVLDVDVFLKDPAWLYYSDAWHPGWRAYLDGRRTEIAQAFGAFKAVEVGPGMHEVRFEYFDGLRSAAGSAIAVMGVLFGAVMVLAVLRECVPAGRFHFAKR